MTTYVCENDACPGRAGMRALRENDGGATMRRCFVCGKEHDGRCESAWRDREEAREALLAFFAVHPEIKEYHRLLERYQNAARKCIP